MRRSLKTRKELEQEYDRLISYDLPVPPPDRSFEKAAVINCLAWVLWGTDERPTAWLGMTPPRGSDG